MTTPSPGWRTQTIAIVGCGGLGVPAAWTLALAGASRLRLIDHDDVELGNLHRQVRYAETDVGHNKARCLADALQARFSDLEVDIRAARLDADNVEELLAGAVAVVEGSDDAVTKFEVNDHVVRAWMRPAVQHPVGPRVAVIAAAVSRRGQWMVLTPAGACYRCLFEEPPPPASLATCETAGVLGPVVGHVGAAAARALVATLDGRADPARSALLRWGGAEHCGGSYRRTSVQSAADCPCHGRWPAEEIA